MKTLNQLKKYLDDHSKTLEKDEMTESILKEYYEDEKLKAHWKNILAAEFKSEKESSDLGKRRSNGKSRNKNGIAIISIVFLIIISSLIWSLTRTAQESKLDILLAEHYNDVVTRDLVKGPSDIILLRESAFDYYNKKDYTSAISQFEQFNSIENISEEDAFFLGLSYLYDRQPHKAIEQLKSIMENKDSQRLDSVIWFLGLAYADKGDSVNARYYLEKVSLWNGNKGKKTMAANANEILDLLNEN